MGKILPLIEASLKNFMRNWRSVVLLIVFPLLLIGTIFFSFSSDGLEKIPVGLINTEEVEMDEFENAASFFLTINNFDTLDRCMLELKQYKQYACIDIQYKEYILLNVHFDNTREPVIWEIVQSIKSAVNYMQKTKTREMAYDAIDTFQESIDEVESIKLEIKRANEDVGEYLSDLDSSIDTLEDAKFEAEYNSENMNFYISDIKSISQEVESENEKSYSENINYLEEIYVLAENVDASGKDNLNLNEIKESSQSMKENMESSKSDTDRSLLRLDRRINEYQERSSTLDTQFQNFDSGISVLKDTKESIESHHENLKGVEEKILDTEKLNSLVEEIDPELLVNPIIVKNNRTYIPQPTKKRSFIDDLGFFQVEENKTEENIFEKAVQGLNLIGLQTLFPSILILITLFLSLLISSFICLTEINSTAIQRLHTIRGIFFPEIISIYTSSLIVIAIPLVCILLLGEFLFQLNIFANIWLISLVFFLLTSIFIWGGMALSYLIRKQSITLLVSTFLLVLLVFLSGFLLPIERMSPLAGLVAKSSPSTISLYAFNKIVFYGQNFSSITNNIEMLSLWFVAIFMIVIIIKMLKRL